MTAARWRGCAVCRTMDGMFVQEPGPDGVMRWVCRDDPIGCCRRAFAWRDRLMAAVASHEATRRAAP